MKLNRTNNPINRTGRIKINENWDMIEDSYNNVVGRVGDYAFNEVVDAAKLIWKSPVDRYTDLTTVYPNPEVGWTAMAREVVIGYNGATVNKVYRYNGSEWEEIQQILADAVNEVDNRLTGELERVEDKMIAVENSNATKRLNIQNYLGNSQNVHPKHLYFEEGWNGYKHWIAYTPYPYTQAIYENPCVSVSNDEYDWVTPPGGSNPVYPQPAGFSYNSDTHLVYREDLDRLELWWREVLDYNIGFHRKINRMFTTDGVTWSPKETIFDLQVETDEMLSPAIIFEDNKYKYWYVYEGKIYYKESLNSDGTSWSSSSLVNINYGSLKAWHVDVEKTDLGYEFLFCTNYGPNEQYGLYHCVQNGSDISEPKLILLPSKDPMGIDNVQLYRSCLTKIDGVYHIYYSYKNNEDIWSISLLTGRDLFAMHELKQTNYFDEFSHRTIAPSSTLTNYDVSTIDTIRLNLVNAGGNITINSFVGGRLGKTIRLYVWGAGSKATVLSGNGIILPNFAQSYTLSYQKNTYIDLICSNEAGTEWRAAIEKPDLSHQTIAPSSTLTNYDVSAIDVLRLNLVNTGGNITINSFTGGYIGKKITLYVWGSGSKAVVNGGSGIILPNFMSSYDLNFTRNGYLDLVCSNEAGTEWRAAIEKPLNTHQTIAPSATLTNYDVSSLDVMRLNLVNAGGNITINSLRGGYIGKRITLYVWGAGSTATLNGGNGLVLPNFATSLELSYQTRNYVDLMCSNEAGTEWRALV